MKRVGLALLAVLCLSGHEVADLRAQDGIVSDSLLGYKGMSGALGPILYSGIVGEFDFANQKNAEDASAQRGKATYDAWGARRSFGLAIGEVIFINLLVWAHNEFTRGEDFTQIIENILTGSGDGIGGSDFTQISPRSWYESVKNGFDYDDSRFAQHNTFGHPYHGNLYFNTGRSNGYGYWPSMGVAILGSFMWECCAETHPMTINDWIDTSLGGSVMGEMLYRVGSTVLDNESTGSERVWRELGNGLLNPVRGINRLFGGRTGKVGPNPEERRPERLSNTLTAGVRALESSTTSSNGGFFEQSSLTAFFEVDYGYGDGWAGRRQGAFEFFDFNLQVNFGDEKPFGRLQIRGNLYSSPLKGSEKTAHTFSVLQNYDYVNNFAFEFGGQSFSAAILSRWQLSSQLQLRTQIDATALLMGAVNSEYTFADDYGPGLGGRLGGFLYLNGRQVAALQYRMQWIHKLNGSAVNFENRSGTSDADHIIQVLALRGRVPITKTFGIGADAYYYVRDSFYAFEGFGDVRQRVPQFRFYGTWDIVY